MANLPERSEFDEGVYQIELTDPVIGGPNGISNRPIRNLVNRTRWLYDQITSLGNGKANKESPALTGAPTAAAPGAQDNSTRIATTGWVRSVINALATPAAHAGSRGNAHGIATETEAGFMSSDDRRKLDSIARGAQANAVTSVAGKTAAVKLVVGDVEGAAPTARPTFSGRVSVAINTEIDLNETGTRVYVPTRSLSAADTGATEAASKQAVTDYAAPKSSPAFSGEPTAPTPSDSDNSSRVATTAWVRSALASIARSAGFNVYEGGEGVFTIKLPSWLGGIVIRGTWATTGGTGAYEFSWGGVFSRRLYGAWICPDLGSSYSCGIRANHLNCTVEVPVERAGRVAKVWVVGIGA